MTGQSIDVVNNPGQSQSVVVRLPPGTYPFICLYHQSIGMTGTLVVTKTPPPPGLQVPGGVSPGASSGPSLAGPSSSGSGSGGSSNPGGSSGGAGSSGRAAGEDGAAGGNGLPGVLVALLAGVVVLGAGIPVFLRLRKRAAV